MTSAATGCRRTTKVPPPRVAFGAQGERIFAPPSPAFIARPSGAAPHPIKPQHFLGSVSLAVGLNLAIKPAWVLVENAVQDHLGHGAFGRFSALLALASVVAGVADLGLTQHTTRRAAADASFLPAHLPTLLPLKVGLSAGFLVLLVGAGAALGYHAADLGWLALLGASLLLTQFAQFLRGAVQGRQRFRLDAVLSVLEKGLLLALVGALLASGGLTMGTLVGARVGAALLTGLVFSVAVARLLGGWVRPRLRWPEAESLLRGALPLAFITLLYGLNERVDMIMLERLAGPRETGYYAAAYRWNDAVMMYLWTVLPLFYARFAHLAADRPAQRDLLWLGQRVAAAPLLLVVVAGLLRGEVLFSQFGHSTPAEVARMTTCLHLLFLNVLVHAFFAVYSTLLTSTGYEKPVAVLVAGSLALNMGLNLLLVPQGGALAAALNTLLCAVGVSVGYMLLVSRRARVTIPWPYLARLALTFGLTLGVWLGLKRGLDNWLVEGLVTTALFGPILLLTGVVRPAELRALLNRRSAAE